MDAETTVDKAYGNQPLLFTIAITLITLMIWGCLYRVQFLSYDENYGMMGWAFLLSCAALLWIGILFCRDHHFIRKCWWQTIGFLILASPFTVILVVTNHKLVFGDPVPV